ncbi:acetoin utilization transport system permease protein [Halobacillus dabanensis]|uniref:Acetoin utilization transport system permease protein n=1 Tax=Halobacillus dabanensis TaxID=240302 RepID=A0A1I3RJR8_HALDA|nr:FtsX-like permease family protein [Halobacillus dabanensis]SFJ46280.1 acetoin utilization transport system permease protein [Halobacillus dabanensis]
MRWKDRFNFIRQNMKKNKSRVFMTILATSIGCAFLIVLASVGFGAQRFIVNDIMADRAVTEVSIYGKEGENPEITEDDIEAFQEMEDVKAVSHKIALQNEPAVLVDDYSGPASVSAVDFSSEKKAGLNLSEGRMPEAENEVLIGYHLDQYLTEDSDPEEDIYNEEGVVKEEYRIDKSLLNETIQLEVEQYKEDEWVTETFPLEVVGIMEEPARDWRKSRDLYISEGVLSNIEAFTGTEYGALIDPAMREEDRESLQSESQQRTYNEVQVIADNMEQVESISQQLKDEGYHIYSVTEELDQINIVFAVVKTGLIIVGTIALLIASIGIYNTMSMAVTERTQDIGIMKAIGGHPRMIRSIFLMESGYIGLMGAFVGVAVAYLVSIGINMVLPFVIQQVFDQTLDEVIQLSYIPPYLALICVVLSIGVAMLSGLKPAKKATKIDVLSALRRDV